MYTLFGFKGSGSASVECALEMTGAPYRIVEAASWEHNDALAELERVNPLKQIPTLQLPDGSVLSESAAILMHLGFAFPHSGLLPRRADRARPRAARARLHRGELLPVHHDHRLPRALHHRRPTTPRARPCAPAPRARLHQHWDIFADLYPVADDALHRRRPAGRAGPASGRRVALGGHAPAREDVAAGVLGAAGAHRFASGGGAGVRPPLADAGADAHGRVTP